MSEALSPGATRPRDLPNPDSHTSLTKAKASIKYLINPASGPQPTRFRTRALLRSLRYIAVFAFWRLLRYAKYAAVGAAVAAVSGTAIGSIFSGAAFVLAPTGIIGGAGVGIIWALGKFGWRRATARMHRGEHGADARADEHADAEGAHEVAPVSVPRTEPW